MPCPRCGSEHTVKHGRIHNGKAKGMCRDCRRQFVPDATKKVLSPQTWELIDKLLLEKIPLAGISEDYLREYVNRTYEAVPRQTQVRAKQKAS